MRHFRANPSSFCLFLEISQQRVTKTNARHNKSDKTNFKRQNWIIAFRVSMSRERWKLRLLILGLTLKQNSRFCVLEKSLAASVVLKQNADAFTVVDSSDRLCKHVPYFQDFQLGTASSLVLLVHSIGHDDLV